MDPPSPLTANVIIEWPHTLNDLVDFYAEEPYENIETTKSHAFPGNENDNTSQNNNDEVLNASFISDTGEFMDVKMSVIDKDTPIYQVCENDEQFNKNCNCENLESTSITSDNIEEQMNQPVPIEPLDMNDSLGESIIKEIADRKKEKTKHHEEDFQADFKNDIKNPHTKKAAVKLLIESFGNLLSDSKFLSWLANKLDYFPSRLKTLIDNHEKSFSPT